MRRKKDPLCWQFAVLGWRTLLSWLILSVTSAIAIVVDFRGDSTVVFPGGGVDGVASEELVRCRSGGRAKCKVADGPFDGRCTRLGCRCHWDMMV